MPKEEMLSDIVTTDGEQTTLAVAEKSVEADSPAKNRADNENVDPRQQIYSQYKHKAEDNDQVNPDVEPALDTATSDDPDTGDDQLDTGDEETEPKDDDLITVKIYGEERQIPKEEVDAAGGKDLYQIKTAREERLREVNEERRRLKEERLQFDEQRAAWDNAHPAKETAPDQEQSEPAVKEKLVELHQKYRDAMFEEDAEGAVDIQLQINQLVQKSEPGSDANVSEIVNTRLAEYERTSELKRGNAWYKNTYPDIYNDEMLNGMANNKFLTLKQEFPEAMESELIHDAVESVNEWMVQKTGKKSVQERVEKKRRIVQPKAASARQAPKPEMKPQTRAEIIAEIRQARGLEQ